MISGSGLIIGENLNGCVENATQDPKGLDDDKQIQS